MPQVTRSWKGAWALRARVGLVLDVSHPVVVQVGASSEALSTGFTLVWLFSCVDSSVSVQGRASGESFLTEVTHIRPGSRI